MAQLANPLLASHPLLGCQFISWLLHCPSSSCLWPRKTVQDGLRPWDPITTWETWKRLSALDQLSSCHCSPLESELTDGRSLFLLTLYICLTNKNKVKNFYLYLFTLVSFETESKRETVKTCMHWLTSQIPTIARADSQSKATSWELHPHLYVDNSV